MVQLRGVTAAIDRSDPEPAARAAASQTRATVQPVPQRVITPVKTRVVTGYKPRALVNGGDDRVSRVSGPQQVILDQLAILKDREIYPASRATLAAFCKVSPSSSGYEKNLGTLKTLGMIAYPRQGEIAFTAEGQAAAAAPFDDGPPAADFWLAIVHEPKAKILRVLIDVHPTAMSRGAIAQRPPTCPRAARDSRRISEH